jgi:hypothetical protein
MPQSDEISENYRERFRACCCVSCWNVSLFPYSVIRPTSRALFIDQTDCTLTGGHVSISAGGARLV